MSKSFATSSKDFEGDFGFTDYKTGIQMFTRIQIQQNFTKHIEVKGNLFYYMFEDKYTHIYLECAKRLKYTIMYVTISIDIYMLTYKYELL